MQEVEYVYYLYGTKKGNKAEINDAFNFGLMSKKGADLESCMSRVDDPSELKNLIECCKYKCVYVVKIPKMYLEPKVVDGQLKQVPVPMWTLSIDGTYLLKSNLVHGAYNKKIKSYFPNNFYNEVFCPNGLQFDIQQLEYFKAHNLTRWIKFYEYRKNKPFYSLKNIDRKYVIWKDAMTQYTKIYNQKMVKKLNRRVNF